MLIIVIYFIIWALLHSALASLKVKTLASKLLGESVKRWYRLFFVIVAIITLLPLLIIYLFQPREVVYMVDAPWSWLMVAGQGVSILALVVATWQSGLFQFIGISQMLADPQHFTGNLVTIGIFHYVRHPLYLFSMLFMWLSPRMTQNQLVLYGLMTLYFIIGSIHEEQILADEFGEAYLRYKEQVPRFIPLPGRRYRGTAE
jgi:protein-S-isoprenylcysteine O-methyltransferase Ste14